MSDIEVQEDGKIPIYTACHLVSPVLNEDTGRAVFAISPFHITYDYEPGNPIFPSEVSDGDWTQIIHHGLYDDGEILASRVFLLRQSVIDDTEAIVYDATNNEDIITHQRHKGKEGYPLHITWDSKGLPPVEAGKRLKRLEDEENSDLFKFYTRTMDKTPFYKPEVLEANGLEPDTMDGKGDYLNRIKPIFNFFNPMGIWKRYKAEPKED
tara:strand:+ start:390 stop:1019 length:630 start_codon:yes stop_codon:yes gene_type:complete